jgi:hypothetical protein
MDVFSDGRGKRSRKNLLKPNKLLTKTQKDHITIFLPKNNRRLAILATIPAQSQPKAALNYYVAVIQIEPIVFIALSSQFLSTLFDF